MQKSFYACSSQGHFVEGGAKDIAFTGQTGAEERRRSNMSIARLHTVCITNAVASAKQEHGSDINHHSPEVSKLTKTCLNFDEE